MEVGDDLFNLRPVDATRTEFSFKSMVDGVNANQGFQISNHGFKLVMNNFSCNFSDLYASVLIKLKEEFNLRTQAVGPDLINPDHAQNEQQNSLSSVKRVLTSHLSSKFQLDKCAGSTLCMHDHTLHGCSQMIWTVRLFKCW